MISIYFNSSLPLCRHVIHKPVCNTNNNTIMIQKRTRELSSLLLYTRMQNITFTREKRISTSATSDGTATATVGIGLGAGPAIVVGSTASRAGHSVPP